MSINLDVSTSQTVVVTCTDCGWFSAFGYGREEAHVAATNHERREHPESKNARRAAQDYARRHAADSSDLRTPSAK